MMRFLKQYVFVMILVATASSGFGAAVHAVQPDEILSDPKLESRAREISGGLRCLVCQNQSIDDSDAPLARDLRILVRERLQTGESNEAVRDYIVARYGEFVLLKPPFGIHTLLLWLAPLFVLSIAVVMARRTMGRRSLDEATGAGQGLNAEERQQLDEILAAGSGVDAKSAPPGSNGS